MIDQCPPNVWCVYLLECSDGSLYCGITNDLNARVCVHNSGKGSKYVRSRRPVKIAYAKICENKSASLRREHFVKSLSRQDKLRLIRDELDLETVYYD
jgi:putative endonuclease